MPHIQVSEETLEILDIIAKLVLELFDRYEQGFECFLVRDIPAKLMKEFDEKIVKKRYPHLGEAINIARSEAFQDLMRKAIQEQQEKEQVRNS